MPSCGTKEAKLNRNYELRTKATERNSVNVNTKELLAYESIQESFPAIASAVTSYARAYLYNLIQIAGYHHCYYSDTDSLIVDKQGCSCEQILDIVNKNNNSSQYECSLELLNNYINNIK